MRLFMSLALLAAVSCSAADGGDSSGEGGAVSVRHVALIIPPGETATFQPTLPVQAFQCDEEVCVEMAAPIDLKLLSQTLTASDEAELRLYWWEPVQ